MRIRNFLACAMAGAALFSMGAQAAELRIVHGNVGKDHEMLRTHLDAFEAKSGHSVKIVSMPESTTDQFGQYKLWLAAQSSDIDVYRVDVIWASQIATHFVDLAPHVADIIDQFVPAAVESQTVNGKLVALPMFLGAPALYYRKDLLDKYSESVPTTWQQLTATAKKIQDAERAAGNDKMWGFVFQGAAYEGLTCDAQEWVASFGGGRIIELDGTISINNPKAAKAIDLAASWIGTIAPEGVLSYKEEDARGVWQTGNAVFMRNWNYAYALSAGDDSAVKGKFDVSILPTGGEGNSSAATLGGWHLGVTKYSKNQDAAIALVRYLNSYDVQKDRAILTSRPPTLNAVYTDAEVMEKQPFVPLWKPVVDNALPRPSIATKRNYNEVSKEFWSAVHATLSGDGNASVNLAKLEKKLKRLKGAGW